jgi:hypothetical protein
VEHIPVWYVIKVALDVFENHRARSNRPRAKTSSSSEQ